VIQLEPHAEGTVLRVKAQAGARSSALRGQHNGCLKVSVSQIAEKGKANKAILQLLARQLKLRGSQLQLISGPTSSEKRVLVRGITPDELERLLQAALQNPAGRTDPSREP
jgi:uncharacterized protein YggU (UPF0235/DUF167 family)